jgi:hypothetical protein
MRTYFRAACWVALAAGVCLPGCGRSAPTVSGKVSYRGRPVTSGVVVFVGAGGKASRPAVIKEDGSYTATGVPVGPVKVAVDNPPPLGRVWGNSAAPPANDPEVQEAARRAASYVPTPHHYGDANQSGLSTTLKSGKNAYDIQLQ